MVKIHHKEKLCQWFDECWSPFQTMFGWFFVFMRLVEFGSRAFFFRLEDLPLLAIEHFQKLKPTGFGSMSN
jgi:hypothetical protein